MSVSDEDVTRLFRVRRTVLQMLEHRQYIVMAEDLAMTLQQFKDKYGAAGSLRDQLEITVQKKDNPDEIMMVFFGPPKRMGIDEVRHFTTRLEQTKATHAIVIAEQSPTPRFNEHIATINADFDDAKRRRDAGTAAGAGAGDDSGAKGGFRMQVFQDKELLVNITEHVLVPKHLPLTRAEVDALLKKYKLKLTQLPRIQASDPIARYYGLGKGDVVKIVRQSETAGRYVTYRTVI